MFSTGQWSLLSNMKVARMNHASCKNIPQHCLLVRAVSYKRIALTPFWYRAFPVLCYLSGIVNDVLYIMGGVSHDGQPVSSCECYDLKTQRWLHMPNMHHTRMRHAASSDDTHVYVTGGLHSNTAECFDIATGEWTLLPKLSSIRYDHSCVHMDGLLYVLGGSNMQTYLSSVEAYNSSTERWIAMPAMPAVRYRAAACTFTDL